jgi:hypothetical protein
MANPGSSSADPRTIAGYLYLSAAITIVVGIVLGFVLSPVWFAVVGVGALDIVLARVLFAGKARPLDAAAAVETDPSYNPYARED